MFASLRRAGRVRRARWMNWGSMPPRVSACATARCRKCIPYRTVRRAPPRGPTASSRRRPRPRGVEEQRRQSIEVVWLNRVAARTHRAPATARGAAERRPVFELAASAMERPLQPHRPSYRARTRPPRARNRTRPSVRRPHAPVARARRERPAASRASRGSAWTAPSRRAVGRTPRIWSIHRLEATETHQARGSPAPRPICASVTKGSRERVPARDPRRPGARRQISAVAVRGPSAAARTYREGVPAGAGAVGSYHARQTESGVKKNTRSRMFTGEYARGRSPRSRQSAAMRALPSVKREAKKICSCFCTAGVGVRDRDLVGRARYGETTVSHDESSRVADHRGATRRRSGPSPR